VADVYLRKTSLLDYPGKVASVLFFSGCNLRCPWCQNRDLVTGKKKADLTTLEAALALIRQRRSLLGGVVLSGGEPSLYPDLSALIREIRGWGLLVKLDTNGMAPPVLEGLFSRRESRPDYIALDLKLAPARYGELLPRGAQFDAAAALEQSAALIRDSGIPHEFRTLCLPQNMVAEADIDALAPLVDGAPWYFRPFRPGNCLDPAWNELGEPGREETARLAALARSRGKAGLCP
jgi:pyruvate formate lyase activating enzyme